MTTAPIPRLPNPLTPETIDELMKARPYWDFNHPQSGIYRRLVQRGFEIMYPGPLRRDAIGRQIDDPPQPPERIAHLVAKENREMDEFERALNGTTEGSGGGMVHVRAHTRMVDGKLVEVSAYEREAPEGSDDELVSPPESRRRPEPPSGQNMPEDMGRDQPKPVPMVYRPGYVWENGGWRRLTEEEQRREKQLFDNIRDSANARSNTTLENAGGEADAGDAQAGTDDGRPKSASPVPNPKIRNDGAGGGYFGAPRENNPPHKGIDIEAKPGDEVVSPVDGKIDRITPAYEDPKFKGLETIVIEGDDNREYKFLYVTPKDGEGNPLISKDDAVKAGDPIGTVQDRASYDRTGKMKDHIHIEIRDESKKIVDPTPDFERWRNESKQSDSPAPTDNQSPPESH